jgi:hypothetical protein
MDGAQHTARVRRAHGRSHGVRTRAARGRQRAARHARSGAACEGEASALRGRIALRACVAPCVRVRAPLCTAAGRWGWQTRSSPAPPWLRGRGEGVRGSPCALKASKKVRGRFQRIHAPPKKRPRPPLSGGCGAPPPAPPPPAQPWRRPSAARAWRRRRASPPPRSTRRARRAPLRLSPLPPLPPPPLPPAAAMSAARSWYRDLFEECGEYAEEVRATSAAGAATAREASGSSAALAAACACSPAAALPRLPRRRLTRRVACGARSSSGPCPCCLRWGRQRSSWASC